MQLQQCIYCQAYDHAYQKINTFIDNAEDIDIVVAVYNLLEYSGNYSKMSRSLWNYYKDEVNDSANENNDANNYRISTKTATSKSFDYKAECQTIIIYQMQKFFH